MKLRKIFSMKELVEIAKERQVNKFDCNIIVSGARGNGKSTFLFKFLSYFKQFKPWEQQVYSRDHVIELLESQTKGIIFDDEAITTMYKREFYNKDQQKLIKMINMYRDNFNIYCSAVPNFYSLDKDIRSLTKIHIHIVKRGMGVVHISNTNQLYQDDPWDVSYNKKLEESFQKKREKNMEAAFPYYKLSSFRGYVRFGDLGPRQRELYEKIKKTKRKELYDKEIADNVEEDPKAKLIESVINGIYKDPSMVKAACHALGYRYESIVDRITRQLKLKDPNLSYQKLMHQSDFEVTAGPLNTVRGDKIVPRINLKVGGS
tara:strand:- start:258 stop:1211 length:954 start_codon:yes stop_codon:yes gene_type:complete